VPPSRTEPADIRVVAVGVDRYHAGPAWSLTGPVEDSLRFVRFFLAQGIPAPNVTLLTSPVAGDAPDGVVRRPADRATVREVLVREVASARQSTLFVVWGGHGHVDREHRRRLFYADATDEDAVDLDLDSLLRRYASALVPKLNRQVWLVDACQTHESAGGLRTTGHETFAAGAPIDGRSQDVIFAAGVGQPAANLNSRRTGLFSREVLSLLESDGLAVLDQPESLLTALRDRFTALRNDGLTAQVPTYLWHRSLLGDESYLLDPLPRPRTAPGVPLPVFADLVEALLSVPEFQSPNEREHILSLLSGNVRSVIHRGGTARADAVGILQTCLRRPDGLRELGAAIGSVAGEEAAAVFRNAAEQLNR
jgi:hypothetical protein